MEDRLTEKIGNMYCVNHKLLKKFKIDIKTMKKNKEYIIDKQREIIMLLVKKLGPYEEEKTMGLLFYSKRNKLAELFKKFCKKNNVDDEDITNVVTWLYQMDLLDEYKVEKYLKEITEEAQK